MNVNKFSGMLNLLSTNRKSKSHRKLNNVRYMLLRYFKKLFYRNNKLILKKKRYLKFLLRRTKNFNKKRNFNIRIRLKKLSNFSGTYSSTLNLVRFDNNRSANRSKLKTKINNYSNSIFVDAKSCFNISKFSKLASILFFFRNSLLLKILNLFSMLILNSSQLLFNFFRKLKYICYSDNNFNIVPSSTFNFKIKKLLTSSNYNVFLKENLTP